MTAIRRLRREKYDCFDAGLATVLFVVLENLFLLLYQALPASVKSVAIVGMLASFGLEFMFAFAGYLTSAIRGVDFFKASKMNKKISWGVVGLTFVIALIAVFGFNSLSNYFIMFLEGLGYKTSLSNMAIGNFGAYILYLFLVAAVPAVFEEICFRGTICAGLEKKNKHLAVWLSAFIFMIMHGGPEQTIHQFILGVIFGYIFVYTGNLWVTILIHFFNNAIAVTMMFVQTLIANGADHLGEITEEVTTIGFEGFTGVDIVTSLLSAFMTAVTAGALIFFITKAIKKRLDKVNNQNKETENAKLSELTDEGESVMETPKKNNDTLTQVLTIVAFVVSCAWLIFEWVIALVSGFMG